MIFDAAASGVLLTSLIWGKRGLYLLAVLIASFAVSALLVMTDAIEP